MLDNKSIGVLIPAYNEEKKIEHIIRRVPNFVDQIIVVDDGSYDRTREISKKCGALVFSHNKNRGKGASIKNGLSHIKTDIVVFLDADGQHRPEDIPNLVRPLVDNQADFVIGSRVFGGISDMPIIRIFSNTITSVLLRMRTGVKIFDTQCGFRATFSTYLQHKKFKSNRYEIESEMLLFAIRNKLRIKEVPIELIYTDSKSHFSGRDVINFLKSVILG